MGFVETGTFNSYWARDLDFSGIFKKFSRTSLLCYGPGSRDLGAWHGHAYPMAMHAHATQSLICQSLGSADTCWRQIFYRCIGYLFPFSSDLLMLLLVHTFPANGVFQAAGAGSFPQNYPVFR